MLDEEVTYILALKNIPGIGDTVAKQLISYCGSPKAVFNESTGKLKKIPNIGEKTITSLNNKTCLKTAEKTLENSIKKGVDVIPYYSNKYPKKLKLINDGPLVLYYKGKECYQDRKIIGIVGTRNATEYGRETTERIIEELTPHNVLVVSGLAYGIDITAHKAALKNGLDTIGVMAGGLDSIYPALHSQTAKEMIEQGGLMSEQAVGTSPMSHYFPARNRIIAGMSDALIVVEAAEKGGALITANIAYSYNREVFAVPGDLKNKYSAGCNHLIGSQKATIYTGLKNIEYNLNWDSNNNDKSTSQTIDISQFTKEEQHILLILNEYKNGLHIDELSWKSQFPINKVVSMLLNLEFAGTLKSLPGKRYKIIGDVANPQL